MRSLLEDEEEIEIPPNGISLDLLQAVYRSNRLPLHTRMRAAGMAIPYECPRLMATAIINENSFAELLEKRLKRIERMEQQKVIEAKPAPQIEARPQIETKAPPVHTNDRRYRRV